MRNSTLYASGPLLASAVALEERSTARIRLEARRYRVLDGHELPTADELLAGMPFAGDDIGEDMRLFVESMADLVQSSEGPTRLRALADALRNLAIGQGLDDVRAVDRALGDMEEMSCPDALRSHRLRCRIYLGHLGDKEAAMSLAFDAVSAAYGQAWHREGSPEELVWQALGWLGLASTTSDADFLGHGQRIARRCPHGQRMDSIAFEFKTRVFRAVIETYLEERSREVQETSDRLGD